MPSTTAARCGSIGATSHSSQRTIVVVPSAPGSSVNVPPPENVPSWLIENRVGGSKAVIVTGSVDARPYIRTVASPSLPTRGGPGVIMRTAFMSCIQRGCPSMSERTAHTRSIGASMTARLRIDAGPPVARARSRRSSSQATAAPRNAARSIQRITAGSSHDRPPQRRRPRRASRRSRGPVAGRQVDRRDRIGEERGLVAERDGVERRRLDAVVGRQTDDDDAFDARPAQSGRPGRSGSSSPVSGSRIENPE